MNKLTCNTTPAILALGSEYKVSPYGPTNPDADATWCDTRAEAEEVATLGVLEPREILTALNKELDGLRSYLNSDKFREDPTVQVADVLTRLEQLRSRSEREGEESARNEMNGTAPQRG